MFRLSESWYAEPIFDYEYKSYQLLAYAHEVSNCFSERKFYPYISDLGNHFARIQLFNQSKLLFEESIRRDIKDVDIEHLSILRAPVPDESGLLAELNQILLFAEKQLSSTYNKGIEQLNQTQSQIQISPVGLVISHYRHGYLFFRRSRLTRVYSYTVRLVQRPFGDEVYKDVVTNFLSEINTGMLTNFGEIKWKLIRTDKAAGNAFLIETNEELPQIETLLPLAKKHIIKQAL